VGCKFSKDRFLPVGPLHPENEQFIDISGDKMVLLQDHPIRSEPHDFIIFKRELLHPKQVYSLDDFPLATKDPKQSGVVRNGKKVTVRLTSQAPAYSLREFKLKGGADLKPGDRVLVDQFKPNEKVDVTGISTAQSGFWYFLTNTTTDPRGREQARSPWSYRTDLRLSKGVNLGGTRVARIFAEARNLFNQSNILTWDNYNIPSATLWEKKQDPTGDLNRPTTQDGVPLYDIAREIYLGIDFSF
ncbi:MAG: hypothetical protein ONB49_14400, partial [candidate division KSB1 bacterium]|nr:hypothetical protein [candidate division KSB1 bacterium]